MNTVGNKVAFCRSCEAPIVWAVTAGGKASPFDAKPETRYVLHPGEDGVLRSEAQQTYTSHFATCPQGDVWRQTWARP
jgi:hypothetical protein